MQYLNTKALKVHLENDLLLDKKFFSNYWKVEQKALVEHNGDEINQES